MMIHIKKKVILLDVLIYRPVPNEVKKSVIGTENTTKWKMDLTL